jgi:transglutaminase-like putative cysteine protease
LGENSKASPDMAEFLNTNVYLDSSDPLIVDLAEKAKGKKKEIAEIAKSLTTFVHGYVASKNFSVGFASASEVARSREGDCTEHSILLAAMGRAIGIPSRVATGLVYAKRFQGQRDILVYHMWTQFFVDGRWINYDSALGYEACPADRILFAVSSLNGEDLIESMLPVMEFIQNLKVRLKSSQ